MGSSPRVRGKRSRTSSNVDMVGLIPARAGKTPTEYADARASSAHPRACGENNPGAATTPPLPGSSPRVRGKLKGSSPLSRGIGLIPARAGKTRRGFGRRPGRRAHPRACGENPRVCGENISGVGSSPRVRGKRPLGPQGQGVDGLIPARAGKTLGVQRGANPGGAHPRACGENRPTMRLRITQVGSSPRVRGKRGPNKKDEEWCRLIPARAGKTCGGSSSPSWTWAHPRACGENGGEHVGVFVAEGSSPRVRGKP